MIRKTLFNRLISISILLIGITIASAQEGIPASGGDVEGSGGTISYTVGYIGNTAQKGNNGSFFPGLQQPYEISVITGYQEISGISLTYSVQPNPVNDILTLKINNDFIEDAKNEAYPFKYSLFDGQGKMILSGKTANNETDISMEGLAPSIYILKVVQTADKASGEVKTFRIIKN